MSPVNLDPAIVATAASSALGLKLLSPSAEAIGHYLRSLLPWRVANAKAILDNAGEKVGHLADEEEVSGNELDPRILGAVMDGGSWCADPLVQGYFGGLLAGAVASSDRVTDAALPWIDLVGRLSSAATLVHYNVYGALRAVALSSPSLDLQPSSSPSLRAARIGIPLRLADGLDLSVSETAAALSVLDMNGLVSQIAYGPKEFLVEHGYMVEEPSFVVHGTRDGVELFLRAFGVNPYGRGSGRFTEFLDESIGEHVVVADGAEFVLAAELLNPT